MPSSSTGQAITSMLHTLLRPLIQLLIRNGVSYQVFCDEAKKVFIDVADRDFREPNKKQTTANITMLTGINRKEVSRQLKAADGPDATQWEQTNRGARIVLAWSRDPDFLDHHGQPRALSVGSADSDFTQLVKKYGLDISAGAILNELQRIGAVSMTEEGRVALSSVTYIPHTGDHEKLWLLGMSGADLIRTFNHNLDHSGADAFVQRYVYFDNIPQQALTQIRNQSKKQGAMFVDQVEGWLRAYDRDANPTVQGSGRVRAGMGIYYFETTQHEKDD